MKQDIGERLAKYRKRKGLSQEQLSFELGVSRQAISKWERGESSPDTENLIQLSKLYGVSLDELLYKDPEESKINDSPKSDDVINENSTIEENDASQINGKFEHKNKDYVHIGFDGIHVLDEDGDEVHIDREGIRVNSGDKEFFNGKVFSRPDFIKTTLSLELITSILFLAVGIIYLVLGFLLPNNDGWRIYWTLFFTPLIVRSFIASIKFKRVSKFNMVIAVTFIYTFIGMYLGMWHPTWLVFLIIPLFYSIFEPLDNYLYNKRKKKNDNVIDSEIIE